MPLRKIKDFRTEACMSPEHNPPSHMVMESGVYEYECPACGKKQTFEVPLVTM